MASTMDSRSKRSRFQHPHFEWARQGRISAISMFLDTGGDIEGKDLEGRSLLSLAALHGHYNLCYWLISKGAEVDCIDIHGNTPLMIAACKRDLHIVELLIGTGADPLMQNAEGLSAIDFARKNQDTRILKALAEDPHSPKTQIEKIVRRLARKLISANKGRIPEGSLLQ